MTTRHQQTCMLIIIIDKIMIVGNLIKSEKHSYIKHYYNFEQLDYDDYNRSGLLFINNDCFVLLVQK